MDTALQQPSWRFLDTGAAGGYENMATDEAIFLSCRQGAAPPTLRLYGWKPPAVSLGYFQKVESAVDAEECRRRGIGVVRRMTGGRAVLHHHELTYAVIAPDNAHPFSPTVLETYMTIGSCLLNFFNDLGLNAQWVALRDKYRGAAASKHETASCFSAPSWYEITVGGKKICGSAQKRGDGVFLQHGSILIDHDPDELAAVLLSKKGKGDFVREIEASTTSLSRHLTGTIDVQDLGMKLLSSFQNTLGVPFSRGPLTAGELQLKELLRREKYQTAEWNCRGSSRCAAVA
jgi:lipoyl(octanoyl) transferase